MDCLLLENDGCMLITQDYSSQQSIDLIEASISQRLISKPYNQLYNSKIEQRSVCQSRHQLRTLFQEIVSTTSSRRIRLLYETALFTRIQSMTAVSTYIFSQRIGASPIHYQRAITIISYLQGNTVLRIQL